MDRSAEHWKFNGICRVRRRYGIRHGLHGSPLRTGVQGHVASDEGTYEADAGEANRPRRASGPALDDG